MLLTYELDALPVLEGESLVRLLSQTEVLRALVTAADLKVMPIAA